MGFDDYVMTELAHLLLDDKKPKIHWKGGKLVVECFRQF